MNDELNSLSWQDQLRFTGSTDQLYSVRRLVLAEGSGEGMRLIEVCTAAGMRAAFLESHALDLYELNFRGVNLGFMTKNGLVKGTVTSVSGDFTRTWPGGFLVTCGLRNTGVECMSEGEYHPQHGRIAGMAAEHVGVTFDRQGQRLVIQGHMRESAFFAHHLVLNRTIEIPLGGSAITWHDQVENLAPEAEPLFLLYHFNFGYPFLSPRLQLHFPPGTVLPRTDWAREGLAEFDQIHAPQDGFIEQVYFHQPLPENPPAAAIRLVHPKLGLAAQLSYSTAELPELAQWKCLRSTDYALGIEPGTSRIRGRAVELADGYAQILPGFGRRDFNLRLDLSTI
jgi:hypothetical protein